jgi:hypothetical protein
MLKNTGKKFIKIKIVNIFDSSTTVAVDLQRAAVDFFTTSKGSFI